MIDDVDELWTITGGTLALLWVYLGLSIAVVWLRYGYGDVTTLLEEKQKRDEAHTQPGPEEAPLMQPLELVAHAPPRRLNLDLAHRQAPHSPWAKR